jgi:FMN phosphatase YigB (HAD superfamily)
MNKVLLLDFDGVIFKHKSANIVSNRAARYVKNHVNVSNRDSHIINKYLYKSFGHTATGLMNMGYKDVSMEEYNKFVYNNIDYKKVFKNTNKKDTEDVNNILKYCKKNNIHPCIFTNAPPIWYNSILDCMDIDKNQFEYIHNHDMLKPNKGIYDLIEYMYQNHDKFYFVDDSFVNFIHTLSYPRWVNVMFDNKKIELPDNGSLKIINDLKDIINILDE